MKILTLLALPALALTAYSNASLPFSSTLACESCIRGGFDFCHWTLYDHGNQTKSLNCTEKTP